MKDRHMNDSNELDIDSDDFHQDTESAVDAASSQDKITWLTEGGKRIAAIVPVDVAEAHEADIRLVLEALSAFRSDYEATSALPPEKLERLVRLTEKLEG
jgi:hypothetical protein